MNLIVEVHGELSEAMEMCNVTLAKDWKMGKIIIVDNVTGYMEQRIMENTVCSSLQNCHSKISKCY